MNGFALFYTFPRSQVSEMMYRSGRYEFQGRVFLLILLFTARPGPGHAVIVLRLKLLLLKSVL